MFYKPNYCCNCGEKIERPEPSFTDSGRFCEVCKHDFVLKERLPQVFVVLMAFVGIFGFGSFWRGGAPPPNVSTKQFAANPSNTGKNSVNQTSQVNANQGVRQTAQTNKLEANLQNAPPAQGLTSKTPAKSPESSPNSADEAVYFCGAQTKKGTPCSRRVKGGGRCWQHKGQNAMLPPEKLRASQ